MRLLLALLLLAPSPILAAQSAPAKAPISFRMTPVQAVVEFSAAKTDYKAAIDKIASIPPEQRTFANTIKAYEEAGAAYGDRIQSLIFLKEVSAQERLRNAADIVEDDASKFGVEMAQRADLHEAFHQYVSRKTALGETLSDEDQRLLDFATAELKNAGLGMDEQARARLREVNQRLDELAADFSANISKHKDQIEVTLEELKGLPDDYIQGLSKTPEGKHVVGLSYPEYIPFITYAENGEKRRELSLKYNNRAAPQNLELMAEALKLRDEKAKLLGYKDFPSWRLANNRMAKTPEEVLSFLNRLLPRLMERGRKELAALVELKKKDDPAATTIQSWERSYYSEKLRRARYDFDPEEVKKYFPVDRVVAGTLKSFERVLGVKFEEVPNDGEAWHKDVRLFSVSAPDGRRLGHFYLDLFPRDNKYSHAAMFPLVMGREKTDGSYNEPVAAVVTNFPKPGADGKPATLSFGDVTTFFHEFGHAMHHVLTESKYATLSGTNVPWDFVEAPSQMLENFVWDREVLNDVSGLGGDAAKPLPDELLAKMRKASRAFTDSGLPKGLHYLRQISMAMADMALHATVPQNVSALFNMFIETIGLTPVQPGSNSVASFGHLMGGYSAGYYSYLWAEVIEKDLFTPFKKGGVFGEAGARYRKTILASGNRKPLEKAIEDFLGRPYNDEAFMDEVFGEDEAPAPAPQAFETNGGAVDAFFVMSRDALRSVPDVLSAGLDPREPAIRVGVSQALLSDAGALERLRLVLEASVPGLRDYKVNFVLADPS